MKQKNDEQNANASAKTNELQPKAHADTFAAQFILHQARKPTQHPICEKFVTWQRLLTETRGKNLI